MNRLPFVLSTIALAVLAACSSQPQRAATAPAPAPATTPITAAPAPVAPAPSALRAGFGRIESIHAIPGAAPTTRRVAIRMEDGTLQHFDTQAAGVAVGDRIEMNANGTMRHPA